MDNQKEGRQTTIDMEEAMQIAVSTAMYASPEYPVCLLTEEAGEVMGKLNKFARKNKCSIADAITNVRVGIQPLRQDVVDELGDVFWAWIVSCDELGIDPIAVIKRNQCKLRDRMERGVINGEGDKR